MLEWTQSYWLRCRGKGNPQAMEISDGAQAAQSVENGRMANEKCYRIVGDIMIGL